MDLINKYDHKDNHRHIYKEIFDKIVKEKFDGIRELTNKTDHRCLTYYFKGDTAKIKFDDFNNDIERFEKYSLVK